MSTWDKCCQFGKFKANFAKTQKNVQTLRKIERNPQEKKKTTFPGNEVHVSNSYADKEDDSADLTTGGNQLSFSELGLNTCLLNCINSLGFSSPKRAQNKVLYHLSERMFKHTVIKAPEKSGKTSATLLWVVNELLNDKNKEYPKALIICPTYEIANSAFIFVEKITKYCQIKIFLAMKGKKVSQCDQANTDLVIATPEKALELLKVNVWLKKKVKYLVIDDVHYMSGAEVHLKTLSHVCSLLPPNCHIILCSIELYYNEVLDGFIEKHLIQNQTIEIKNDIEKVIPEELFIVYTNNEERFKAFICLEKNNKGQTVVFCNTREESNRLKQALDEENISVEILNSKLTTSKRTTILQQFKENETKLLIATYSFLELLESENVTKVINYEQVLNDVTKKLNPDTYNQIENRLNGRKNCLICSFIEKKWEDALIPQQAGATRQQVYPNAKNISAIDLINGQKF